MERYNALGICSLIFVVALIAGYAIARDGQSPDPSTHHHIEKDSAGYNWIYCPELHRAYVADSNGNIICQFHN